MRGVTASFIGIFAVPLFILGTDAAAITFDDGLVHVIDAGNSFPLEDVIVQDGPSGATTTVSVVDGGDPTRWHRQLFFLRHTSNGFGSASLIRIIRVYHLRAAT